MADFNVYETIASIRPHPAMHIGYHSLTRLQSFLDGCFYMAEKYAIRLCEHPDFHGFHDWTAERFGWKESTAGWCNIILQESNGDEAKALDSFFRLVEEYRRGI